ncbi:hypothetical protein PC129_g1695 [Phytophthora cactorum]|uniref:Uncharacterized protein n=1 Tax=Phytophthora cactorum TaxID=29920 RepID=A0A8T1IT32_9STRA|nr:hypothetical protein Pcac1_g2618 [Phytophthora cactorum]KAG2840635.1 hypothetical protein PC112_g3672 [Phytophthora cactorum]KAG2924702.1 hypothetical protein PC114_g4389 [Phytophthora cactorum]KAG2938989.1 hypothetical protein PC115_g3386 [Phytophthora cactorum]KAG2947542.1 hypothetical protein PC117_g6740 [Phytophthora cactorum]
MHQKGLGKLYTLGLEVGCTITLLLKTPGCIPVIANVLLPQLKSCPPHLFKT